jgi:hypothetical protein
MVSFPRCNSFYLRAFGVAEDAPEAPSFCRIRLRVSSSRILLRRRRSRSRRIMRGIRFPARLRLPGLLRAAVPQNSGGRLQLVPSLYSLGGNRDQRDNKRHREQPRVEDDKNEQPGDEQYADELSDRFHDGVLSAGYKPHRPGVFLWLQSADAFPQGFP